MTNQNVVTGFVTSEFMVMFPKLVEIWSITSDEADDLVTFVGVLVNGFADTDSADSLNVTYVCTSVETVPVGEESSGEPVDA